MPKSLPLRIISQTEAAPRGVLVPRAEARVLLRGEDRTLPDLVCGQCGCVIAKWVSPADLLEATNHAPVKCRKCGSINDLEP